MHRTHPRRNSFQVLATLSGTELEQGSSEVPTEASLFTTMAPFGRTSMDRTWGGPYGDSDPGQSDSRAQGLRSHTSQSLPQA